MQKESVQERNQKMQADRDAGIAIVDIAKKYGLTYGTVSVTTRAPKRACAPAVEQPKPRIRHSRTSFVESLDNLLEDLEEKRIARVEELRTIEECIAATKKVLEMYRKEE